jgi:microsomal dipeptidase-like Zn-dependent dipeptidase
MLNIDFSIDLHCHPTYKPLGKSHKSHSGDQSPDPLNETSLWYYDSPKLLGKLLNEITGITKFSQANFTASSYGNVWVMAASLGSIEKWFFNNKLKTGVISDVLSNFATGISVPGVNAIQNTEDYFNDLQREFGFLAGLNNRSVSIDGNWYKYKLVSTFFDLQQVIKQNEVQLNAKTPLITIAIIPTIEGMHVLNCGLENPCDPNLVLANAKRLKGFHIKPWFVTLTHHFYNELCGHSHSLMGPIGRECNQEKGVNTGFTDLGKAVLAILLDNTDGRRILVDIKHLSPLGRQEYFAIREEQYPETPIIISHGACNGLPDVESNVSAYPELGNTFYNEDINFYDSELILMAKSGGIIGLQLDERRVASEDTIKRIKHSFFRNKIMHYRSILIWNQIQYIAELLDKQNLPAWNNIAIGSDYDGIVDPLNSFWTIEQYPSLKSYLERHAFNYMQHSSQRLLNDYNKISADEIVQRVFQTNGWDFFERWY